MQTPKTNNSIKMPLPKPPYSEEVIEYITLNGWHRLESNVISDGLIFVKDALRALVFIDDQIEYKEVKEPGKTPSLDILFNWECKKHYKGFDGKNVFQLMWLLDFMGAISLKEINKELRREITTKNLINEIPLYYKEEHSDSLMFIEAIP